MSDPTRVEKAIRIRLPCERIERGLAELEKAAPLVVAGAQRCVLASTSLRHADSDWASICNRGPGVHADFCTS